MARRDKTNEQTNENQVETQTVETHEVQPLVTEGNLAVQPAVQTEQRYDEAKLASLTTVSAKIRYLDSCGLKRGEIAKKLGKLYQHVRNVLKTPLKTQN